MIKYSDHVPTIMGTDVAYTNATAVFENLNRLKRGVEKRGSNVFGEVNMIIKFRYSTWDEWYQYFKQSNSSMTEFKTFHGDAAPYLTDEYEEKLVSSWTGYYATRMGLKTAIQKAWNEYRFTDMYIKLLSDLS